MTATPPRKPAPLFPPPRPPKLPLFARTPPAIFSPLMGLFGLGLAWRRWSEASVTTSAPSDLILGGVSLLLAYTLLAYAAKMLRRPGVILEDLRILPGRSGLAAASLCVALFAATLVPYAPDAARILLWGALITHLSLAGVMIFVLASGPAEQRQVTPIWHLSFVGFILLPLSAVPLGYTAFSQAIFGICALAAALIYAVSLGQMLRRDPPPPLRPLLAIHLAPVSLFGTVSLLLDLPQIALGFAALATLLLAALLVKARYLIAAGFSPLWGAFTFPLAAYTSLVLMLGGRGLGPLYGDVARIGGTVLLGLGTVLIGYIAYKVFQMWAKGTLAVKTNAATA